MAKEITLKVAEAVQDDVNKGIVRIDSNFMKQIEANPGDVVEIEGKKKTVGIVGRAYPGDIGLNIIRMDGDIRKNAKASIGETVNIRKTEVNEAKKILIAPAQKGIRVSASPIVFKRGLLGRVITKGDIVSLGGAITRKKTTVDNPLFDEVFSSFIDEMAGSFGGGFGLGGLKFIAVSTTPANAVVITERTQVEYKEEAVEKIEEEQISTISYEDIGGLEDEIKKIREMVELPLKHPEIFQKLGIEPPKGVLLHGPPGTGKTLLAKAVASETESNFIVINGPEIMGKFYGQSLPGDEKILVVENGCIKRIPIGEVVENNKTGLKAVCFDKEGKVSVKEITGLIKHKNNSKILEIATRTGRKLRVTDYHSLFTIGEKGIESIKTSDLVENKSYIAVPKQIPFPEISIDQIDLIELLRKKDYGLRIRNIQNQLKKAVSVLSIKQSASILGVREKYVYDIILKNVGVPVSKYVELAEKAGIEINKKELQICTKGKSIPAILNIDEKFCTFLGLWMAEGSYTQKNEVRISLHEKEVDEFNELITALFGSTTIYKKPNSKGADIIICSTVLGIIMKYVLGFCSGARNKKVPEIIYNLDRKNLAAFLRGYFTGDGSLNLTTPAPFIEVSTESPELADDISYLLLYFGIVPKIYSRKNRPQKRICFASYENLEKFREIGFIDESKNLEIYKYVQKKKFARRDQLPITGIVKSAVDSNYKIKSYRRGSESIGANVLQVKEENPIIKLISESDIYWDKVISIKKVENVDYVYDISVSPDQNFVAGFGGIFAHNSEENLRKKFEEAEQNAPSIIFIDEIDAIAAKREEVHGEVERRVVAQLLALMDGIKSRGKVVVIAASNRPDALDPALRRPGRFDREIELGVPKKLGRLDILKIHTRNMPIAKDVNLDQLANVTHGFVGADLEALAKEAAMVVLRKVLPDLKFDKNEPIAKEILDKMIITMDDFKESLKTVRPSALREVVVKVPDVSWEDIGGMENVKQELKEAVEWPLKNPEVFTRMGIKPPKAILLYGAPGTGKTLLAKAVAHETEANFILVNGPELLSKWVGESEAGVRKTFHKARQVAPSIIFFDEIDSLAPRRGMSSDSQVTERVVNQLLTEMDGLQELTDVVIIGATNRPDIVDPALLRPGRFDRIILAEIPDVKTREKIFEVHTEGMPIEKEVNIKELAEKTEGYVGADIEAVCREAAMLALREDIKAKKIGKKHFDKALEKVLPSVDKEIQETYQELADHFKKATAEQIRKDKPSYLG